MSSSIRPLHDRVLVRPLQKQRMSEGGIDLSMATHNTGETHITAEVMAIGAKVSTVAIGEMVLLPLHTGTKVADGQLMVKELDLLGVLEYGS